MSGPSAFEQVADGWAAMKDWVTGDFPKQAVGKALADSQRSTGDHEVLCPRMGAGWSGDGDSHMDLSELRIAGVEVDSILDAYRIPMPPNSAALPVKLTGIAVEGRYYFGQPCAYYDRGILITKGDYDSKGTVKQTVTDCQLHWEVSWNDKVEVTLKNARIDTAPTIDIEPDTGGLPDWMVEVMEFLRGDDEKEVMRQAMQDAFTSASFSKVMVDLLNGAIHPNKP